MPTACFRLLALFGLNFFAQAWGLDVSGIVLDKLEQPVSSPKICSYIQSTFCTNGDANGVFHFKSTDAIQGYSPSPNPIELEFQGSNLWVNSQRISTVSVEWIDVSGKAVQKEKLDLKIGRNEFQVPKFLSGGLYFFRLRGPEISLTQKVVLVGQSLSQISTQKSVMLALAKVAHHEDNVLVISKTGYKDDFFNVGAGRDTLSNVVIHLRQVGDSGFYANEQPVIIKVMSIDRISGLINVAFTDRHCGGDTLSDTTITINTTNGSFHYSHRSDTLYLWKNNSCIGSRLLGSNIDIIGDWALDKYYEDLPADLQVPNCKVSPYGVVQLKGDFRVSDTAIVQNLTYEYCPGQGLGSDIGSDIESLMSGDTTVKMTTNTCRRMEFKNGLGDTAKVAFTQINDSINTVFNYGSKSCYFTKSLSTKPPQSCPTVESILADNFLKCIRQSGFGKFASPFAKISATSIAKGNSTDRKNPPMSLLPGLFDLERLNVEP